MTLDKRLAACACLVPKGACVCDVGTDHGYLPVWLVKEGIAVKACACDIGEGPLSSAVSTINKCGLSHKISTSLSDGLKNVAPDGITHIVIAGMGGETILNIIESSDWPKGCTLILQPMTKLEFMREGLCKTGWEEKITKADIDGKYSYIVSLWKFENNRNIPDKTELVTGGLDLNDSDASEYLRRRISVLQKSAQGKLNSRDKRQEGEKELALAKSLERLLK